MNYVEKSYKKHEEGFDNDLISEERIKISNTWFDKTTADYWRHMRGYRIIDALD